MQISRYLYFGRSKSVLCTTVVLMPWALVKLTNITTTGPQAAGGELWWNFAYKFMVTHQHPSKVLRQRKPPQVVIEIEMRSLPPLLEEEEAWLGSVFLVFLQLLGHSGTTFLFRFAHKRGSKVLGFRYYQLLTFSWLRNGRLIGRLCWGLEKGPFNEVLITQMTALKRTRDYF